MRHPEDIRNTRQFGLGCKSLEARVVFAFSCKLMLLLASVTILSGCERISGTISRLTSVNSISGSVLPLQSLSSSSLRGPSAVNSLSCSSKTASLYQLSSSGARVLPALKTVDVESDGTYTFSDVKSLGVQMNADGVISGAYLVEATACTDIYSRPITGARRQNLSVGSTLVGFVQSSSEASKLAAADHARLESLISNLETFGTYTLAYNHLTTDASTQQIFQDLFVSAPTILQESAPQTALIGVPTTAHENEAVPLSMDVSHWKSDYSFAYHWEVDGVALATTRLATYTTHANSQGDHVVKASYGSDSGGGILDQTKPYQSQTFTIHVSNDVLPQPPALSIVGSSTLTTNTATLQIATGASLANCESFSALALTEENTEAPTSPSAYNISCTQSPTQNFTHTLATSGTGTKTLRLWARDAGGNISAAPQSVAVQYDGPVLSFASPAVQNQITNTSTVSFSGSCEAGLTLTIAGGTDSSTTTCTGGTWSYTTASRSTDSTRTYTFKQTDAIGNSSTIIGTWQRDATLPVVALTSLDGGQYVKGGSSQTITWTASDANLASTPVSLDYSSNGGSSWASIASNLANSGSYIWTAPLLNGSNFKVRVSAQDAVNTGSAASSSTFRIDSSNPVVTLTALNGGQLLKGGETATITWTATDANLASTPISLEYSANGGSSWTSIASNLANSGTYSWTIPSQNGTNFKIKVTAVDLVSNAASAASTTPFTIDSTAPSLALTSLTGGQTIAGNNATRAITWTASDANFGANPISIDYSANSGTSWTTIASNLANSGTYTWTVNVADGGTYRVRIRAIDIVGNSSVSASSTNFAVTSSVPNLTQTTIVSPYISNSASTVTFGGTCDLSPSMGSSTDITVSGPDTATVPCTGSAPTGAWTYTTAAQTTDGSRTYNFSQTNAFTTQISATWIRDTLAPQVSAVTLNNGDAFLQTTLATAAVTVSDVTYSTGLQVRVASTSGAAADCQALYADNSWNQQINPTMTWSLIVPDGDGVKKICAWAKDAAGNVSVISPVTGTQGVDMNTIQYANATPPQITAFSVRNASNGTTYSTGDNVHVSWTATDSLGLDNNPIKLEYTTNGTTWTTIESAYGGLTGNPTTYTYDYYGFNAPSSGFFRLRVSAKNVTGQTSAAIVSGVQNGGNWSVYAGTTDRGIGGSARSAVFYKSDGPRKKSFAFHPVTGDLYAFDDGTGGLLKVDAHTGLVSQFIKNGSTNLPTNGTLPASPTLRASAGLVAFDNNNLMYVMEQNNNRTTPSARIFQINLSTNQVRLYLGSASATLFDATATPSTIYVNNTDFEFDESNNLYFFTSCAGGGTWNSSTLATRLMKVTQNSDGTPGTLSVIAGNCTKGTPTSGQAATSVPLSNYGDNLFYSLAVWNNGSTIYYSSSGHEVSYKILNGTLYSTAFPTANAGLIYSKIANKLYVIPSAADSVLEYSPHLSGAGGEIQTATLVNKNGTGDCNSDGTPASATCMNFYGNLTTNSQGQVFFGIGGINAPIRVGYVDSSGAVRVYAGTLPANLEGMDKSLIRGIFTSIYYKQPTELNQAAFPSGLYFYERTGVVIGKIDDTGLTTALVGNQTGRSIPLLATGTAMSKHMSLSNSSSNAGRKMTFDDQGLPWFIYSPTSLGAVIASIDANKQIVRRQAGGALWDYASLPTAPASTQATPVGGEQNLAVKGQAVFLFGRHYSSPTYINTNPLLRLLDFSAGIITQLMGTAGTTASPDTTVPGPLTSLSIDTYCINYSCAIQFVENNPALSSDDILYFSEAANFRKITDPITPANNLLTTVFTAAGNIQNFTVRPDQSQVFYTIGSQLYCHALLPAGSKTWCNDTSLGPTTGMNTINKGPNQLAWKDANTLLISTHGGEIFQFVLPP